MSSIHDIPSLTPHPAERPVAAAAELPDGCSWDTEEIEIIETPEDKLRPNTATLCAKTEAYLRAQHRQRLRRDFARAVAGEVAVMAPHGTSPDAVAREVYDLADALLREDERRAAAESEAPQ